MALIYTVKHAGTVTGDLPFAGVIIPYGATVTVQGELPASLVDAYRAGLVTITDASTGTDAGKPFTDNSTGTADATGILVVTSTYAHVNNNFATLALRYNALVKQVQLLAGQVQMLVSSDK